MQKSYILQFDKIKGDYVIVKQQNLQKQKIPVFNMFAMPFRKNREQRELEYGLNKLDNQQTPTPNVPAGQGGENNNPPAQTVPQSESGAINVADSLPLIASLYQKFGILNMIFQNLRDINNNNSQIFVDYINLNKMLQGSLLNIYNSLGASVMTPTNEVMPALPSSANEIYKIAADYIQDMRELNFELLNLFKVEDIDRQLNLIETALSIQANRLTNLQLKNI